VALVLCRWNTLPIVLEALGLSHHCQQKCDIRAISDERLHSSSLNGETYVVSINEFSATCNWQVVGVQVEQNRCKDRALRKAVTLGLQELVSLPMCTLKRRSKQQTHQSGEPIYAFTQFVKKTSEPDSVICCC